METPQNAPPVVTTSLGSRVLTRLDVRFRLEVTDDDGDAVSLRLLNPPPGLVLHPIRNAAPPAVQFVRWIVPETTGGPQRLIFEAHDDARPEVKTRHVVDLRVENGNLSRAILQGDVTGDGILDVVAGASEADVGGQTDAGAIYVWAGATTPSGTPTAELSVPGASALDQLGRLPNDRFNSFGQGIQLQDVTGDGLLDIVAGSSAQAGGVSRAGAIYIWSGGPTLTGAVSPMAELSVGGAAQDRLGSVFRGQGLILEG